MERMAKRDKQRRGVCGFVTRNLQLDGWMGSIRQSNGDEWQFLSLTRTLSFPNVDVLVYGARNRTNSSIRCETKVARFRWIGNNASFKTLLPLLSVNKTERGVGEGGGGGGGGGGEREREREAEVKKTANEQTNGTDIESLISHLARATKSREENAICKSPYRSTVFTTLDQLTKRFSLFALFLPLSVLKSH